MEIAETAGIAEIMNIAGIASSNLHVIRRRVGSIALLTQRSGARFIVQLDTI
jgi:hypothetical protein